MQLKGTVQVPLYNPGYTIPGDVNGIRFDPNGMDPAILLATGSNVDQAPPSLVGYIPQVGLLANVNFGTPGGLHYQQPTWAGGFTIIASGIGDGGEVLFYMPFDSQEAGTQDSFLKFTFPTADVGLGNTYAPVNFAPPLGELDVSRKYGSFGLEAFTGTGSHPSTSVNMVLIFEYGGTKFQGFGINQGGDDPSEQWGYNSWLDGGNPTNNGFLDVAGGQSQNYTYFPGASGNRPGPVIVAWTGQQFTNPDFNYRNGQVFPVTFDDPVLVNGFSELSCTRNGWTAVLRADNFMFPGSKWAFIYMDYPMQNYYILRMIPQDPLAARVLTQTVYFPSFKIGADGISWMLDPLTGDIFYSFSENLAFAPAIYPVPAATFGLPCFDPCNPDLWESQINNTLFKSPVLGD